MIETLITLGLSVVISIIGIYLRKAYIESEIQEEIKNKQETENLVVRNKKIRKAKKDLFNSVISSNEKGKQEAQKELQRLLNSDAAKEVAEVARAIASVGMLGKGLGRVPKMRNVPSPPIKVMKEEEFPLYCCGCHKVKCICNPREKYSITLNSEEYASQDKSAFFDLLDVIVDNTKEPKKFKKQEVVNDNIHDPITGELLNIVQCSCKTISDKDSYLNYGCPNCGEKIINKK